MQHLIVRSVLNHGSIQFEPYGIKEPLIIILKIYLISINWEVFLERMAGWSGWLIAGGRLSCAKGAFRWSAALCGRKSLRLLVGFIYLLYNSFAGDGGSGNADPVVGKATVFPAPLFLLQAVGEP